MSSIVRYQETTCPYGTPGFPALPPADLTPLTTTYPMVTDGNDRAIYHVASELTSVQIGTNPWQVGSGGFPNGPAGALLYVIPEDQINSALGVGSKVLNFSCKAYKALAGYDVDNKIASFSKIQLDNQFDALAIPASNPYNLPEGTYFSQVSLEYNLILLKGIYAFTVTDKSFFVNTNNFSQKNYYPLLDGNSVIEITYVVGLPPNTNVGPGTSETPYVPTP